MLPHRNQEEVKGDKARQLGSHRPAITGYRVRAKRPQNRNYTPACRGANREDYCFETTRHRQETPGDWFVRRENCVLTRTQQLDVSSVLLCLPLRANALPEHAFHRHMNGYRALVLHMLVSAAAAAAAAGSKRAIRGRRSAKEFARIDQPAVTRICGSGSDFLTDHHIDQYRSLLPSTHTHTHTTHDARRTDSIPRLCAGSMGAAGG